jgi:hypothetical protein
MRPLAAQLALIAAFAVSGCSVFKSEGAACASDTNCPGTQVCCSGKCEKSCDVPGSLAISATLATDYVPGYEVDTFVVQLDSKDTRQLNATPVTEVVNPRPIGQFTDVRNGRHSMTLTLLLQGAPIASRVVSFTADGDMTVPFVLTRDCAAVSCRGAADQCAGGRCVPSDCSDLNPSACPSPACAHDEDCTASDTCTKAVCLGGLCMQRREDGLCAADERCVPGTGCVVQKHECDVEVECDDLVSCTQERCRGNRCISTPDDTRCGATVCDPTAKTANASTGCTPAPCNSDNCTPGPCQTASCQDGECKRVDVCQSGEQCCNGVCAMNCNDPRACAGRPAGYVCRVPLGTCDVAEVCDGTSDACPPDVFQPTSIVCRAKSGDCDTAENCDGTSANCPLNALVPAATVCRAIADVCDSAEVCTGESAACPVDVFQAEGTTCRASAGSCDVAEVCSGSAPSCPGDALQPATTVCRAAAGPCDAAETCPGNAASCPGDTVQPGGAVCRASQGACDLAETCDGTNVTCPVDAKASGPCRDASGVCDVAESCDGVSNDCPANVFVASGTQCASAFCATTACDGSGNCSSVTVQNTGASCDAATCAYCTGTGACSFPECQGANECRTPGRGASGCVNPCSPGHICP